MTANNGKEYAGHEKVTEHMQIDYFFARPFHSWERAATKNINGLIRQYFPKKTDFSTITDEEVQKIETKLNTRPIKWFNYENPIFVMNQFSLN